MRWSEGKTMAANSQNVRLWKRSKESHLMEEEVWSGRRREETGGREGEEQKLVTRKGTITEVRSYDFWHDASSGGEEDT